MMIMTVKEESIITVVMFLLPVFPRFPRASQSTIAIARAIEMAIAKNEEG